MLQDSKGAGEGFEVSKYGDGRVALIGFPSVGKSTLLTQLTGTKSEAASYEFTTLTCIPGIIHYNDAKIQLLDLPGIIEGAAEGKGARGRRERGDGGGGVWEGEDMVFIWKCALVCVHWYVCMNHVTSLFCHAVFLPTEMAAVRTALHCMMAGRGRQVISVCKSADLLLMVLDAGKPHYHRCVRREMSMSSSHVALLSIQGGSSGAAASLAPSCCATLCMLTCLARLQGDSDA